MAHSPSIKCQHTLNVQHEQDSLFAQYLRKTQNSCSQFVTRLISFSYTLFSYLLVYTFRPNWLSPDGCRCFSIWVLLVCVCGMCHASACSREFGDCSCVSAPL